MPTSTYTPLYSTTTGSTATEIDVDVSSFTTYTDLVIYVFPFAETGDSNGLRVRFNGDTGNNYSINYNWALNTNTTPTGYDSGEGINESSMATAWNTAPGTSANSTPTTFYMELFSYRNTSLHKNMLLKVGKSSATVEFNAGRWKSTSAITSIQFRTSGGASNRLTAGTRIVIWGIKAGS
jgi:hypothetical protein